MHAPRRLHHSGLVSRICRRLCWFVGIDPRCCFCWRCIAVRTGLFHRTRVQLGDRTYADVRVLGIRVVHRFVFELP